MPPETDDSAPITTIVATSESDRQPQSEEGGGALPLDSVVEEQVQAGPEGPAPPDAGSLTPAGTEKYNLQLDQTRKSIAMFLLWILFAVVALYMVVSLFYSARCFYNARHCGGAERALALLTNGVTPVFTAMIGVIGSVVGFYFGSKRD